MKAATGAIADIWNAGGPFVGDRAAYGFVTVELGWELEVHAGDFADFHKVPVRWFQRADGSEDETIVPNVRSIERDESVDQDAATCTIVIVNQLMDVYGDGELGQVQVGQPGYYTPTRGDTAEAAARWGQTPNEWNDVLTPNALIRTYEGYCGRDSTLAAALAAGTATKSGTWMVDNVDTQAGTRDTTITLTLRDMSKLLIEQTIIPPFVPATDADGCLLYPLEYCRYTSLYGSGVDAPGIGYGTAVLGDYPGGGAKKIVDISFAEPTGHCSNLTEGYHLAGDDGGVFTLGYLGFHGSAAGAPLEHPIVAMAATATGLGYWLVAADGGVFSFGDANFYGSVPGDEIVVTDIVDIERSADGLGYVILGADGGIYTYGDADFNGSAVGDIDVPATGLAVAPGGGYWVVTGSGAVFSYGVSYYGGEVGTLFVDIATSAGGAGYYLLRENGAVYTHGDASYHGSPAEDGITLNDIAVAMAVHPDGIGYWIGAEDGGVFTYGNGMAFYGSLPGPWVNLADVDGNYVDLVDVVRDLALWSGFWLNDGGTSADVFGNLESTGIHADCLPREMFDKQAPIDPINAIKEQVGYLVWCDADGALHFETPNLFEAGNYLYTGVHTASMFEIDEAIQLTGYKTSHSDGPLRSEIIISSYQPDGSVDGTVTSRYTPASRAHLKGLVKPFMWVNELFVSQELQDLMAELIDLQIWMQQLSGSVRMRANPLLDRGDQVRIFERQTSETSIHYVRGIHTVLNLESGEYTQDLTTSWLGHTSLDWGIVVPSALAMPETVAAAAAVPAPSSISGGAVAVAAVAAVASVAAPTVAGAASVTAATVAATADVPAVTVTTV